MIGLLDAIIGRPRAVLSITSVMVLAGVYFYFAIPRESSPNIDMPVFAIAVVQEAISAEDAERLLVKPLEGELRGLKGLKELTAIASSGRASLVAEFDIHTNHGDAMAALREKVAGAKALLPAAAEAPVIEETNLSLLPAMTVALSGNVPERTLQRYARKLKDRIETVPDVLRADLAGHRPEVLEVLIDPARLQSYAVSEAELIAQVRQNNRLVTTGTVDTGSGRFSLKVPNLFDSEKDILSLPIKVSPQSVVTLRDVAEIRRTFKDATSFSRVNGRPAIVLHVVKRPGANIVTTNRAVRDEVVAATGEWPEPIKTDILFDQARLVGEIIGSLEGNIVSAIVLAMAITVLTLGMRSSFLVGISIPVSFLIGFVFLALTGVTLNRMVMFGLVLTVGIVVGGATILVEHADREMARGVPRAEAYRLAASRMFWPVTSSTATAFVVYVPMLFWPGVAGKFMSSLPITVISVLAASMFTTLVVLPAIGAFGAGRRTRGGPGPVRELEAVRTSSVSRSVLEARDDSPGAAPGVPAAPLKHIPEWGKQASPRREVAASGLTGWYLNFLHSAIRRPVTVVGLTAGLIVLVLIAFRLFSQGAEFFVDTEPEEAVVQISGRGNMSAREELELVKTVEAELLQVGGLRTLLTVSGSPDGQPGWAGNARSDQIGQITIEFEDYGKRPEGRQLIQEIRQRTAGLPGIQIEVRKRETGPPVGKPLRLEVASADRQTAIAAAAVIRRQLDEDRQFRDIEDTRPLPSIEWVLTVDREEAGRFGADIASVGAAIQMITNGVLVGKYRPADAENEIDIRARFPIDERSVGQLDQLTVRTGTGVVPISNFVERKPQAQTGERVRKNRLYTVTLAANTVEGVRGSAKRAELGRWLQAQEWPQGVGFRFRGSSEDEREASTFLKQAMLAALFLIFVILVARFDSFYQTGITLLTVLLSVIGVLIGMLLTGQTFSVIMTGTGILALTGIVVSNAIVLIDTFNYHREDGTEPIIAIMRTCIERLRPAVLTTLTTIIGLVPMALQWNFNIFDGSIEAGSVTSAWWVQFATALIFGLSFSTLLMLVLVPTLLAAPTILSHRYRGWKADTMALYLEQQKAADRARRLLNQQGTRQQT
jgi:multidrug efflux pump